MPSLDQAIGRMRERHPRAFAAGVCAELADRLGVSPWLLRVPFIVFLSHATCSASIVYVVLAVGLRTRLIELLPPRHAPASSTSRFRDAASDPGYSPQRDRFSALEQRLARLEAAVTSDELKLRARFRDLEG